MSGKPVVRRSPSVPPRTRCRLWFAPTACDEHERPSTREARGIGRDPDNPAIRLASVVGAGGEDGGHMGRGWGRTTTGARRLPRLRTPVGASSIIVTIIVTIGLLSVSASATTSTDTLKARLDKKVPAALEQAAL